MQFVNEQHQLGKAYQDRDCIFREVIDLEQTRLNELLTNGPKQVLAINPLDGAAPSGVHHNGEQAEPGIFQFENDEATSARVRVSLTYPPPRGQPVFFISYGAYQVPDVVDVTLVLNSVAASSPRAFPYMPPGRRRQWSSSYVDDDELFLTLGKSNTVFGDGDGVVLYWKETSDPRPS